MYIGLASLTVFFAASIVAFFITSAQSDSFRTVDAPSPPLGVFVSTAILILLSLSLRYGMKQLAENRKIPFLRSLIVTLGLSLAFLLAQVQNWRTMASFAIDAHAQTPYAYSFYFLTGLHALHVVLGIAPLVLVYQRAQRDEYSSSRNEGVRLLRQYWDFLLAVWLVLLVALWV